MITKAFYNGEYISVNKIGKLVGVTGHHLVKYFRKCGNIEEAIKIAKDEQQKQKGTIEYNGEILSIKKIADKEGLQHSNLAKHYKNLGNIYDAVIKAKDEKQKQRGTIKYKNEITNIKQIAINEGLTASSLRKHYNQLNNIEEAIKIAKQEQIRQQGTIEYNGSIMTINKIASIEKLTAKSLSIYYEELGNIYDAVNMTKQEQEKHNGNVLYNNQKLSIAAIAKLENINHKSLKKYYEETKDIYKAVLILKNAKQNIKLDTRNNKSYTSKVTNRINENIKNLYNYCLENNINYYVIYYMMKKNNITFEEAVKIYNSKGQNIPTNWIYEEYNLLLKHLLLKYNIDSRRITDLMKEDCISLEKAIEKYIFMKNMSCKSNIMRSYLYDAYLKVTNVENNKFISTIEKLHLNSAELKEFDNCYNEVQLIKRKLLLYEFASIINEWDIKDIVGMMRLYSITIGEIKEIFIELYKPFYDKILFPKNSDKYKRNCIINELINKWNIMDVSEKDLVIQKYSISIEELYYINNNSNKMDKIIIKGARENNLKNIDIELPKNKLIVMTGVSGSGKSSLAFDTIYAEGQRRYVESLSAYARQFLGGTEKPDVDSIEGLSPSISIDQKTTNKNPRSTVATVTEIYDYLRLLYARIGIPYCPIHNEPISKQSIEEMVNKILEYPLNTKIIIMSPIVHGEKGTHKELFDKLRKEGFTRVRVNGENYDLSDDIELEKNKKDNIDVIVDRLVMKEDIRGRLYEAIEVATKLADGKVLICIMGDKELLMSENFACPKCNYSLPELAPRLFSFNAPYGACPDCKGLGIKLEIDKDLVIPNKELSISEGAIVTLSSDQDGIYYKRLECCAKHYKINLNKPFNKLSKKEQDIILYGSPDIVHIEYTTKNGNSTNNYDYYEGILTNLQRRYMETTSTWIREWLENYMVESLCPKCHGARLNEGVLHVFINKKNIYELTTMSIKELLIFFENIKLSREHKEISNLIIKEIINRLSFLSNVGLNYLTLSRNAGTLSGGEAQRIRLATQIGSKLTGVLYVLDEPSIGLHQKDNEKLIKAMLEMRNLGNTLIVVEHDIDTMLAADYLVDIGPGAGRNGGYIIASGTPDEVMNNNDSITGRYLSGKEKIEVPNNRRKGNGNYIEINGATENNLKNINVKFPLGKFIAVTGVSGSGKSTLVNQILYKIVAGNLYKIKDKPGKYKKVKGLENIDKVVEISQAPIGRTPRSNPATYTGVFDDIRDVFTETKEAKIRGYDKSRFSFNVKGGRCEACRGDGVKKIEMHFLPDVYVPCEVCKGTRYNRETLEIKFKEKNIYDILNMRVEEALEFFENIPKVKHKLQVLDDVGLSYIKLGQQAPTLSGGEAARVKLAKELQKKPTGKSLFILDEPTTGLHSADIKKLLVILNRIVDNGDTVIVIEHNLDVIKVADHIIDLGPEGGDEGGTIIATGSPEEIVKVKNSYTGQFLKKELYK